LAQRSDAAVVCVGIREGEGQDRAFLDLPGNQEALINAVAATGKPTVVVLIAGAPVTMSKWIDNVGGVIDAWYPGQEGGTAIADVLFGDVNPAGRLPITFPLSVGQCPTYYNLEPSGRGYDYVDLTGKPLFAFGYGLSYTTFKYSDLKITPEKIGTKQNVTVTFTIENTGSKAGDEVPQLYIHDLVASITRPMKELRDFARITLQPGEKKTITFTLTPEQLSFLDAHMKPVVEPSKFDVMIGASSDDIRLNGSFEVVKK
jgi:beta-glucosidase